MLLSISRSTQKFIPLLGLRSLLAPDTAAGGGGPVVTRTVVASRGACRGENEIVVQESGDGGCIDEEEDDEGCWVSYGCRGPRRWLPPPIPSLASRSTLRRERTEDGRLVITKLPVTRPEYYIRARRRGGRLIMQLVEREGFDPLPAPGTSSSPSEREEDNALQVVDDATTDKGASLHDDVHTAAAPAMLPAVPPPPPPAVGCFEDVVKYHSIGGSSLHQMHMLRMVH